MHMCGRSCMSLDGESSSKRTKYNSTLSSTPVQCSSSICLHMFKTNLANFLHGLQISERVVFDLLSVHVSLSSTDSIVG